MSTDRNWEEKPNGTVSLTAEELAAVIHKAREEGKKDAVREIVEMLKNPFRVGIAELEGLNVEFTKKVVEIYAKDQGIPLTPEGDNPEK